MSGRHCLYFCGTGKYAVRQSGMILFHTYGKGEIMKGKIVLFKVFFVLELSLIFVIVPLIAFFLLFFGNFLQIIIAMIGIVFLPLMFWAMEQMSVPPYFWQIFFTVEIILILWTTIHLCFLGSGLKKYFGICSPEERQKIGFPQNRALYGALAVLAGVFGAHHFYAGNRKAGVVYLSVFMGGVIAPMIYTPLILASLVITGVMWLLGVSDLIIMLLLTSAAQRCVSSRI